MKNLLTVLLLSLVVAISFPTEAKSANVKAKQSSSTSITKINLNKANAKDIAAALKGVGIVKAQAIIMYRKKHGDFKAIEELASVKGIGVATIAKNHSKIML